MQNCSNNNILKVIKAKILTLNWKALVFSHLQHGHNICAVDEETTIRTEFRDSRPLYNVDVRIWFKEQLGLIKLIKVDQTIQSKDSPQYDLCVGHAPREVLLPSTQWLV